MSKPLTFAQSSDNKQYHIALSSGQAGEYAILPGDPGRVELIARHFDNPAFVTQNREYTTWAGTLNGVKVSAVSTGIGGPSAAIAIEELIKCGVHTFIRVGTCGGMAMDVKAGDIIIATAAIRGDGTSKEYLPPDYPAVSDFEVTTALRQAANGLALPYHVGVVQSKDSFYGETAPETMPVQEFLDQRWKSYVRAGCLASEMEGAALMSIGLARGVRVGMALTALWNPERQKAGIMEDECHDNGPAILCVVDAVRRLISAQ